MPGFVDVVRNPSCFAIDRLIEVSLSGTMLIFYRVQCLSALVVDHPDEIFSKMAIF